MTKRRTFLKSALVSAAAFSLWQDTVGKSFLKSNDKGDMKRIGLIGGTSWHSTVDYYSFINQMVNDIKGNRVNPPLILYNLNQHLINELQSDNKWDSIADIYVEASDALVRSGAEAIIFCANTAHSVYGPVSKRINIPILHIADATGIEAKKSGAHVLGLLGTQYTMEREFIQGRLSSQFGFKVIVPAAEARIELTRIIYEELSMGNLKPSSKKYLISEMDKLVEQGAQGIILGCTEFPMLIKQEDYPLPVYDTTYLHSKMAVNFILGINN